MLNILQTKNQLKHYTVRYKIIFLLQLELSAFRVTTVSFLCKLQNDLIFRTKNTQKTKCEELGSK